MVNEQGLKFILRLLCEKLINMKKIVIQFDDLYNWGDKSQYRTTGTV